MSDSLSPRHRAAVLFTVALLLIATTVSAQYFRTYENTTASAIPNGDATCSTSLTRTFTVPDTFTYNNVALGLNISHATRGEIQAYLTPPGGARTLLFASSADTNDNYDILLSTRNEAGMNLNDGDIDPVAAPYYNRLVYSSVLAAAPFTSGAANGTWTIALCDRTANGTNGTLNRVHLVLGQGVTPTASCTSRVTLNWLTLSGGVDLTPFTSTTLNGITVSQGATADYGGTGGTGTEATFVMRTSQTGGLFGFYRLSMDAAAVAGTQTDEAVGLSSTFNFSPAVRDLGMTFLDIDIATNSWEDQIELHGTGPSGADVPHSMVPVTGANAAMAGDTAEGNTANSQPADTTGNVDAFFPLAVSSATTNYTQGNNPTTENNFMFIGLSNFTFCSFDFGDAPNTYGTNLAGNGPKHVLGARSLWLGVNPPDGEADGQPVAGASGDNLAAVTPPGTVDDEDGIDPLAMPDCPTNIGANTYTVAVRVNNTSGSPGYLVGYIDWNRDGDFNDANEKSATTTVANGTNGLVNVVWSGLPASCGGTTATYARFRFTTSQARAESPTDTAAQFAPDGEVEDYAITAGTLPVTIAHVTSAAKDGSLSVHWTTASETANGGFDLFGRNADKEWVLLASVPTQNPDSFSPQSYQATVDAGGIDAIRLEDVSLFGERRAHGPFKVGETVGEEPEAMPLDWAAIRTQAGLAPLHTPGMRATSTFNPSLRKPSSQRQGILQVRSEGIQRVTYEQLKAAGIDLVGIAPVQIAVLDNGAAVPRHVVTAGSTFGPGSAIEFYANPELTLASPFDAFVVTVDQGKALEPGQLLPAAGGPGLTTAEDVYRPDHAYSFSSPNGDPWFDQGLLAYGHPAATTRTFDLPNLADGPVELDLRTWGYGGWPGTEPPDHHVVVLLNGTEIANGTFDDITAFEKTVDVTSLVHESGNTLEVRVPGDTGYKFDYIAFEGFTVRYPRSTVALGQRFGGRVDGDGFAITGFGEGQAVSIWRHDGQTWQRGEQSAVGGQVFAPGGEVHAASAIGMVTPGIAAGVPEPLAYSKAQYVIVTHPSLASAAADLAALERSRGFTTDVVTTDRIFAAYSDHTSSAEALHQFLVASWGKHHLKYVLLVGADTTDPYDHLGTGSVSFVPTDYKPYVQYITFSPTDETLADADGDGVSEVPIGRLPVRTPAELQATVAKIRTWEENVGSMSLDALLTAGTSDEPGQLAKLDQEYQSSLDTWAGSLATVDDNGAQAVRDAVLAGMNAGTPLVSFVGHSAMGQWDFTPILRWQDVAAFTNSGKPNLVAAWGCWNSYYVEPGNESLSARLLTTPDTGAAAAIGATTLTTDSSHQMLGNLFYRQVNLGAATIGLAFHNAKLELAHQAIAHDAILGMALLGDPAMTLPHAK